MVQNLLERTPANLRAEIARYQITRTELAEYIRMNPGQLSNYLNELLPEREWAMHNIAFGINQFAGLRIFPVRTKLMRPPKGRPSISRLELPIQPENDGLPKMPVPGGL